MSRPLGPLPEAELQAERAMLEHARRCLAAMRRRTRSLRASGADPYAVESVEWRLRQRVASLADDERTGLFFGRLDYDATADPPEARFYVGRRHVSDAEGDPVVIDWRAGLAHPFYRASPTRRYGVRVRRRFGYRGGTLTSIQDEVLDLLDEAEALAVADRVLVAEIERPRIGPMRDIVATIQPEQDDLIRAPLADTICIQGGPGTGKTAVGLHRAAFLLYEHRDRLARDGVLVVGPGPAYLAFIRDVLPGLGEVDVAQRSIEDLVAEVEVTGTDTPEAAAVKAGERMAEVVRRAAFTHVRPPALPLEVHWRHRVVRLPARVLRQRVEELGSGDLRYLVARDHLRDWLVERCLRHLEHTEGLNALDNPVEVQRSLRARPEVRAFLQRTWPVVDPVRLVFRLLTERDFLAGAADGILSDPEQELLRWTRRPRSRKAAAWSVTDAFLVDEAVDVIGGTPTFGHVVADEAQDLSAMQLRAIGRRCRFGSATLLGDLAQRTTPWSAERWEDALGHLGRRSMRVEHLPRAFRAPAEVLDFANRLLPEIAPGVRPARSVRSVPGSLRVRAVTPGEATAAWRQALKEALAEDGSVGLVVDDRAVPAARTELTGRGVEFREVDRFDTDTRLALVPASAVKGLEFDQVVLVEPADIADPALGATGLRRLYTALTRAVLGLTIVHAKPLPAALGPAPGG
ncbi:MAG TPA: AAA family ATPase [Actinomycetota bacterium]|nr:AAA family ATPase [Actinomycetota bacterium]